MHLVIHLILHPIVSLHLVIPRAPHHPVKKSPMDQLTRRCRVQWNRKHRSQIYAVMYDSGSYPGGRGLEGQEAHIRNCMTAPDDCEIICQHQPTSQQSDGWSCGYRVCITMVDILRKVRRQIFKGMLLEYRLLRTLMCRWKTRASTSKSRL